MRIVEKAQREIKLTYGVSVETAERLISMLEQAEAVLEELLSAHHNLYRTHWGDCSDSTNDIAAKRARALLAKLHEGGE